MFRGREPNRFLLAAICGLAGLAFGAWMDVYQWTLGARQDLDSYLVVAGTSLPYNIAHAVGNVVFCLLIGPAFLRALERYRRRLEVRWLPAAASARCSSSSLWRSFLRRGGRHAERAGRALPAALPRAPTAASAPRPARHRARSTAAGRAWALPPPATTPPTSRAAAGARSPATCGAAPDACGDVGEIERTVLLVRAAGLDPRDFAGRDLIAEIERRRRADGSISGFVSYTAFGILALRSAGEPAGGADPLAHASQNDDGGFGVARSSASDSDMTGAVLQALSVVGRAKSGAAQRAVN